MKLAQVFDYFHLHAESHVVGQLSAVACKSYVVFRDLSARSLPIVPLLYEINRKTAMGESDISQRLDSILLMNVFQRESVLFQNWLGY